MTEPNAQNIPAVPLVDNVIGLQIDGCTIQKKIGQGGMGIVYLAEHPQLRQQYVVKVLNPALTAAEDTIQRFFREAQSVARLNHPSIVSIQNVGQQGDYYYIRMEYVDGDTVENLVKQEKKLEWRAATKIIHDCAEALSHAHKKGIIHRDIKPENIMFTKNGMVKVMDFGLAKQVQAATKVSITGQIVGTPFFMSPEQAGGKTTDARSDIYSLGVTYYYLLTGVKPFNGKNLQEIFLKHFFYTPESPKIYTPELPEDVCEVIRRCLKKKKKERYQSAAQLAKDLRIILGEEPGAISSPSVFEKERDEEPSASSLDIPKPAPIGLQSDPALTSGDKTQQSVLTPEEREARDLLQAQAEIGGQGEAAHTLRVGQGEEEPPPPGDGGAGAPEETSTAPLQRRGGRVALEQVAAASLVFQPKGKEAPPATDNGEASAPLHRRGGRVALEEVAGASMVFQEKKAKPAVDDATAPAPEDVGVETVKEPASDVAVAVAPRPVSTEAPKVEEKKAPPAPKKGKALVVVGALVLVGLAGGGIFQMMSRTRYQKLADSFARLEKTHPADAAGWMKLEKDSLALKTDLEQGFALTIAQADATALASKCNELASKARDESKKAGGSSTDPLIGSAELEQRKRDQKKFEDAIEEIGQLEAARDWSRAAQKAIELEPLGKKLGGPYPDRVVVPVHVSSIPGGAKVFDVTDGDGPQAVLLGETPKAEGGLLLIHARALKLLKLQIKKPRFRTETRAQPIEDYAKVPVRLQREVRHTIDLGETAPIHVFQNPALKERIRVDVPFGLDPGSIYIVARDGMLRALDKATGRAKWQQAVPIGEYGDPLPSCDVLPSSQALVAAGPDGYVSAWDTQAGAPVWRKHVGAPVRVAPRISADAKYVALGTVDGDAVLLDVQQNGDERWRVPLGAPIVTRPQFQGNKVYVASRDDKLRVLDLQNGAVVATYDAQEEIGVGPILQGDTIYLGTKAGRIHALKVADPSRAAFTTAPAGSPIVDLVPTSDAVYFATQGDVRAVATGGAGGNQLWPPQHPEAPSGATVRGVWPMRDNLAVVTSSGRVEARDLKTGEIAWSYQISTKDGSNAPVLVPPVGTDEDLYVLTGDGFIHVVAGD